MSDDYIMGHLVGHDEGVKVGLSHERERIIALLTATAAVNGYVEIELGKLIALIKGEN